MKFKVGNVHITSKSHLDHNIPVEIFEKIVSKIPAGSFFIKTFETGHTLPCHLHGPVVGESPVSEDEVYYETRGSRKGKSRMCRREPSSTTKVSVIAGGPVTELWTMFPGPIAAKEVSDPFLKDEERENSVKFWSEHALSAESGNSESEIIEHLKQNYKDLDAGEISESIRIISKIITEDVDTINEKYIHLLEPMKLNKLCENTGRCDSCQKKPIDGVDFLHRVPECPSLKFCPACFKNREFILKQALKQFKVNESVESEDENWQQVFRNLDSSDIGRLKDILKSNKGYWNTRAYKDTFTTEPEFEDEDEKEDSIKKKKALEASKKMGDEVDKHNEAYNKRKEEQEAYNKKVNAKNAILFEKFSKICDKLMVAIDRKYNFSSIENLTRPYMIKQTNDKWKHNLIINPNPKNGNKYLTISLTPRITSDDNVIVIANHFTDIIDEVKLEDKKIVEKLLKITLNWLKNEIK